jgi:hypothetical protein
MCDIAKNNLKGPMTKNLRRDYILIGGAAVPLPGFWVSGRKILRTRSKGGAWEKTDMRVVRRPGAGREKRLGPTRQRQDRGAVAMVATAMAG